MLCRKCIQMFAQGFLRMLYFKKIYIEQIANVCQIGMSYVIKTSRAFTHVNLLTFLIVILCFGCFDHLLFRLYMSLWFSSHFRLVFNAIMFFRANTEADLRLLSH